MDQIVVSRGRELAAATDAFERMRKAPATLLIEGEPGIGKTTLWRAAVAAARERGLLVLEARPAEAEAPLSYAALGDLLAPVLGAALADLPRPQRRAIEVALLVADPDVALAQLAEAVRAHEELGRPFELARARQRRVARDSLATAERAFEALGAEGWAERARAEAARVGGRRTADRDELTTSELRSAELAAGGRSNREIAGELFVSERTVEANLTRAYRKLGVRSRTELARRLPATPEPERPASAT